MRAHTHNPPYRFKGCAFLWNFVKMIQTSFSKWFGPVIRNLQRENDPQQISGTVSNSMFNTLCGMLDYSTIFLRPFATFCVMKNEEIASEIKPQLKLRSCIIRDPRFPAIYFWSMILLTYVGETLKLWIGRVRGVVFAQIL